MSFFKKHKKALIILTSILASFVILILLVQLIIGNILQSKLENSLSSRDDSQYSLSIDRVKVNLFTMTLIFKDVNITPDSAFYNQLKDKESKEEIALNINIADIRVRNIGFINLITDKQVNVRNFVINKAKIVVYQSKKSTSKTKKKDVSPHVFNLDSIVLPGLSGVDIGMFTFRDFSVKVIDVFNDDTVFFAKSLDITLKEIALIKNESDSTSFRLVVDDANVHMKNEKFRLPEGKYTLSFGDMSFYMEQAYIVFNNLELKPLYSLNKMAGMSKFNSEIFDIEIKKVEINSFHPVEFIRDSKIYLSDIEINGMELKLYKDKRLPFNEEKRPKLPQQLLEAIKQDLYIDSLIISNSYLIYSEKHKGKDDLMVVTLGSLNAKVSNITSVFDSIINGEVMSVKLNAKLQNKIPMEVNVYFPLNSISDTFSFNGWLGNGDMKLFNPIVLPAIGIKFSSGYLDGLKFRAKANSKFALGEMTMLYHDLESVVVRKDMKETNKFMSWVANTAMIKNNPTENKEKRIVPMFTNRVEYKGIVNFLWKTLQSGITATMIPTMDNKVQNEIYTTLGIDKKEVKKIEREEKRKKRKKNRR